MVKELLYRRSFHCDRDLKGTPDMLEPEQPNLQNIACARIATSGAGFEAPRNSLDVPMETRRYSEVRSEDIPVGYELRRSLTTTTTRRREHEDFRVRRGLPASAESILLSKPAEAEQKTHVQPSLVARLMGLDPLPASQEHLQCSPHPSSRRLSPHKLSTPGSLESTCVSRKSAIISPVSSQRAGDSIPESNPQKRISYGELPYRHHPQEKQLQEFKREFTARLLHQEKQTDAATRSVNLNAHASREKQHMRGVALQESREFLDALDFLHSNKDFFARVLKDPSPLFGKHGRGTGDDVPAVSKVEKQQREKRSKSFPESRKDSYDAHRFKNSTKKRGSYRIEADDRMPALSPYGRDEEMLVRAHQHIQASRVHQAVPTKIVVLRPKLQEKLPANKPTSHHSSPLLRVNGRLRGALEGGNGCQNDTSERLQPRHGSTADIARRIAKQVKHDTSRRLLNSRALEPASVAEKGRWLPARKLGDGGGGTSDGEGYYSRSKRSSQKNAKVLNSLPSSPRLCRSDVEDDHRHVRLNGQKTAHVEQNAAMASVPAKISQDTAREHVVMLGLEGHDTKQDGVRDSKPLISRSHSINGMEDCSKALSRSRSASAAESRSSAGKGGQPKIAVGTANCSQAAENTPFKARLLSLKYSFSPGKKKDEREPSSPLVSTELSIPLQNGESKEPCHGFPDYKWQVMEPASAGLHMEARARSPEDAISLSSLTSSGRHQWSSSSTGDLLDSASDISSDKCEQPSPVSVLEMPFQDESLSSMDRLVTDGCQGTCLQKHLLHRHGSCLSSSSTALHSSFDASIQGSCTSGSGDSVLESFDTCGIVCPPGSEEELKYVSDLLAFAGFTRNKVGNMHAFSAQHGINPSSFDRLESYYKMLIKGPRMHGHGLSVPLDSSYRKLLFDVVDEVLSHKLSEPTMSTLFKPGVNTGKQLLVQIWDHMSHHRFVAYDTEEESLDVLASKDLMKDRAWVASQNDMEAVMVSLERMICGDLIREMVYEGLRR